jgi:putative transposase
LPQHEGGQAHLSQAAEGFVLCSQSIVTDKLGSHAAAKREILLGVEHRPSRYLNNRCEVSHQAI